MQLRFPTISYTHLILKVLVIACMFAVRFTTGAWELNDKHVALLGDSNTWIGGDSCTAEDGWSFWFAKAAAPKSIKSYARSGATWTNTPATTVALDEYSEVLGDNNVIFNQVLRLFADVDSGGNQAPDLIIIAAGTNDAWFADRRPAEFSATVDQAFGRDEWEYKAAQPSAFTSLAESVRYNLLFLQGFFPEADIVVLTPIPSIKISPEMLAKVSEIIADASQRMSCKVVRMDQLSPINPESEMTRRRLTKDGVHTSPQGARSHGEIMAKAVSEMN